MDTHKTKDFIENIYRSFDISHAWIVYDKDTDNRHDIDSLVGILREHDFPIYNVTTYEDLYDIKLLEHKYRMFVIEKNNIPNVLSCKDNDISNISLVLCTTQSVEEDVLNKLGEHDEKCVIVC